MTTSTSARATAAQGAPGSGAFAGLGRLTRFALRRDRVRATVWVLALGLPQLAIAVSFVDLYPSGGERQQIAATFASPAAIAMSGPADYLDDYTIGAMMSHQMLGFTAILVGIMSVLMVVRHTRAEEESGRAELVRAARVGRNSGLAAGVLATAVVNVLLGALIAVAMMASGVQDVDAAGSVLFGAAHTMVGLVFASVAAITVQITEHARAASGLAMAVIGVAYLARAVGDITENGLSWASPIGWAQQSMPYAGDRVWPLLLGLAVVIPLVALGLALSTRRDLGAGLRATRPGRRYGSTALRHPLGFALRLHRGLWFGFGAAMVLLGAAYGAFLDQVDDMLGGMGEAVQDVFVRQGAAVDFVDSFVSTVLLVIALLATVYPVMAALRPAGEESGGRAEPVLSTALSRQRWLASHLTVAFIGAAVMQLLGGFGLGALGAVTLNDAEFLSTALSAALAYVPAIWLVAAIAVLLYGWLPRWAPVTWLVLVYGFLTGYLGPALQLPDWMDNLSPYGHVPRLPLEEMVWTPMGALIGIAASLVIAGLIGFRRRDLRLT